MMYPPFNRYSYQTLREQVFHYDNSRVSRKQLQLEHKKQQGISMGSLPRLHRVFPNCLKLSGFVDHTWL